MQQIRIPRPNLGTIFKMLWGNFQGFFVSTVDANFTGNLNDLTDPQKLTLVYVGHATVFINFFGTTILTDPIYSRRVGKIIKRRVTPGLRLEELPPLDLVLVSHAHFDHLDRPTLKKLAPKTKTLVVAKNCRDLVADLGFASIIELDWKNSFSTPSPDARLPARQEGRAGEGSLQIHAFRPKHWGQRVPWERIQRSYNSYIITKNNVSILFAGDTGYSQTLIETLKNHQIDIALLPIGAYNPPFFRTFHLDPDDAVKMFEEMNAKILIPVHWGVFRLSLEPMDEPPRLLKEIMQARNHAEKLKLLGPGEYFLL